MFSFTLYHIVLRIMNFPFRCATADFEVAWVFVFESWGLDIESVYHDDWPFNQTFRKISKATPTSNFFMYLLKQYLWSLVSCGYPLCFSLLKTAG